MADEEEEEIQKKEPIDLSNFVLLIIQSTTYRNALNTRIII